MKGGRGHDKFPPFFPLKLFSFVCGKIECSSEEHWENVSLGNWGKKWKNYIKLFSFLGLAQKRKVAYLFI